MAEIYSKNTPASDIEIKRAEKELGFRFPKDYIDFLKTYNGGKTDPDEIDVIGMPESSTLVDYLYGFHQEHESYDVLLQLRFWRDNFVSSKPGLLPIGRDPGGSIFLLIAQQETGQYC